MADTNLFSISVSPREGGIGAEVSGIDLSQPLSSEAFAAINKGFEQYRLLVDRKRQASWQ